MIAQGPQTIGVSVIVPVKERAALVDDLLDSLAVSARMAPETPCEVLLVWDGGFDPSERAQAFFRATGIETRCVAWAGGIAEKRNRGLEDARHSVALFVDSDVRVHPDLFLRIAATFATPGTLMCAPEVRFEAATHLADQALETLPFRAAYRWAASGNPALWVPAATVAVRTSTARESGGFQRLAAGIDRAEDADFGLRISALAGRPAVTCLPDSFSLHARETWSGWRAALERAVRFGTSEACLVRRHPAYRRLLPPTLGLVGGLSLIAILIRQLAGSSAASGMPVLAPAGPLAVVAGLLVSGSGLYLADVCARVSPPRRARLVIASLFLRAAFDLSRLWRLLLCGDVTHGIWFHDWHAQGEWRRLALRGWVLCLAALAASFLPLLWLIGERVR